MKIGKMPQKIIVIVNGIKYGNEETIRQLFSRKVNTIIFMDLYFLMKRYFWTFEKLKQSLNIDLRAVNNFFLIRCIWKNLLIYSKILSRRLSYLTDKI